MTLITFKDGTVVMRGNKVGTGQACCDLPICCNCFSTDVAAAGITVNIDLTIPDIAGDTCAAGQYNATFVLNDPNILIRPGAIAGCADVDVGGAECSLAASIGCESNKWYLELYFATVPCAEFLPALGANPNWRCFFGLNGQFAYVIVPAALLAPVLRDDECLMLDESGVATVPLDTQIAQPSPTVDMVFEWSLTVP